MAVVHRGIYRDGTRWVAERGLWFVPDVEDLPDGRWRIVGCAHCALPVLVDEHACALAHTLDRCAHLCSRCLDGPHGGRLAAVFELD